MSTIRLAMPQGGENGQTGAKALSKALIPETRPALLVSYVYLDPFLKNKHRYAYRDWALDSGAFTAHYSGTKIDVAAYTDKCLELMATDPTLVDIFALDVVRNIPETQKNLNYMLKRGVNAIPCWHMGEPEGWLKEMAQQFPKIALGGFARLKGAKKLKVAEQVFARVWPKKIHGFGCGSKTMILALPWHSTDATNWEIGPCKYGRWNTYGTMSIRGSEQNLRVEVEYYLKIEREARAKWAKEMKQLEAQGPNIRLVANAHQGRDEAKMKALGPSVKLAYSETGSAGGERIDKALSPTVKLAVSLDGCVNGNRLNKALEKA